jgi:hypothetical protein
MWLLDRYPPEFVATHTYVNPVIAILLGWTVAGEPVHPNLILACALILASIAVIRSARRSEPAVSPDEAGRDRREQAPSSAAASSRMSRATILPKLSMCVSRFVRIGRELLEN